MPDGAVMGVSLVPIVEGHGEIEAAPILLRRIASAVAPTAYVRVLKPIRVPRSRLLKAGELERAVSLAALMLRGHGAIVILIDADDDCPARLGPELLRRAKASRSDVPISVVLAKSEFEAWFIAAATSLAGHRGLSSDLVPPGDPEAIRGAKGWVDRHMLPGRNYSEVVDQPKLTSVIDLQAARSAPSFDKLWRDLERVIREVRT